MATEYYQIPSSQGLLSLEASSSSLSSSVVLTNSGAFSSSIPTLSASHAAPASDPWLPSQMKTLSLDDWAASTSSLKKSTPPSLFEPDDVEASSWNNVVPQQTPEVLKASFELKNPHKVPASRFLSHSSKLDAWSSIDPTVTISSPALHGMQSLHHSALNSPALHHSMQSPALHSLKSSQSSLKKSTASIQDDDENSLNRYKTELCKSFTETGVCRYGVKCQFAHGKEELRPVLRHPKYKTEICKTFHNTGTCPYGIRCRFIHTRTKEEHHVFGSSSASFVNSDFESDEAENLDDSAKMSPPPGIPVPQWSKSWTPTQSPSIRNSRNMKKMQA